jgi:hypothetical protein
LALEVDTLDLDASLDDFANDEGFHPLEPPASIRKTKQFWSGNTIQDEDGPTDIQDEDGPTDPSKNPVEEDAFHALDLEAGFNTDPSDPFSTCMTKQELETTTIAETITGANDKLTGANDKTMAAELISIIPFKLSKENQQQINTQFQNMSKEELLECWFRLCPVELTHWQVEDMKGRIVTLGKRESPFTPLTVPSADSDKGFVPIGPESNVSRGGRRGRNSGQSRRGRNSGGGQTNQGDGKKTNGGSRRGKAGGGTAQAGATGGGPVGQWSGKGGTAAPGNGNGRPSKKKNSRGRRRGKGGSGTAQVVANVASAGTANVTSGGVVDGSARTFVKGGVNHRGLTVSTETQATAPTSAGETPRRSTRATAGTRSKPRFGDTSN